MNIYHMHPTMEYAEYTSPSCKVSEYMVEVSDGVKLRFIDFDPGVKKNIPIMLFVSGWISLIDGWKGFLQEITPKMHTRYYETREKKTSVIPRGTRVSYTMERLRQDLREVIVATIPPKRSFVLAGSSLGASAIIEYLIDPDGPLPECAVLIGPNAEFRFPRFLTPIVMTVYPSLYAIANPIVKWYLRNFRVDTKHAPEQMRKYERTLDNADPYKLKANALALMKYSAWDRLHRITTPCLIVGAKTDTLHGAETLQRMISLIKHADYIEMESNTATHGTEAGKRILEYVLKKQWQKR